MKPSEIFEGENSSLRKTFDSVTHEPIPEKVITARTSSMVAEPTLEDWEEECKRKVFAFRPLGYSFYGLDVIRFFRTKRLQWVSQAKVEGEARAMRSKYVSNKIAEAVAKEKKELVEEVWRIREDARNDGSIQYLSTYDQILALLNKTK